VFLLIGKTSALTMNIAGVIKDWMLIFFSFYLFKAPLTALNLEGYCFCCSGVGARPLVLGLRLVCMWWVAHAQLLCPSRPSRRSAWRTTAPCCLGSVHAPAAAMGSVPACKPARSVVLPTPLAGHVGLLDVLLLRSATKQPHAFRKGGGQHDRAHWLAGRHRIPCSSRGTHALQV